MTLAEKAGLLFQPSVVLPAPGGYSADEALERARADIQDRLISHFNVLNGESPEEIAEWHSRLQEFARQTRLAIPLTISSDARSGFGNSPFTGQAVNTLSRWPEALGIAATGDPDVARGFGDAIRQEFIAMGIRVYLGPMADIYTDPRWSRGYGTFGEDVDVVCTMIPAFIEGLRGTPDLGPQSVAAVVKHFPGAGPQRDGRDALDRRFPDQVYPGNQQHLHLRPFEAAFAAGVTQVMPYYGNPIGTSWPERGFAFNAAVIRDLLRGHYGFDGIVVSDWNVIESTLVDGILFGPNAYGVESFRPAERIQIALEVGIDQFGGDRLPEHIVALVESGAVSEARIDTSARRLLVEKYRLGLFDAADSVQPGLSEAARIELRERGVEAQRRSLTLLRNGKAGAAAVPITAGQRVYGEGLDWAAANHDLQIVDRPEDADVSVVRLAAPWTPDPESALGDLFHEGPLEFPGEVITHLRQIAVHGPLVVIVFLERPAVLTAVLPQAAAVIAEYGCSDQVLIDAICGHADLDGRLPFDLPRSDNAIAASREDVPFDTADPIFRCGDGLTLRTIRQSPASSAFMPAAQSPSPLGD
jgi:beta-glucosidase